MIPAMQVRWGQTSWSPPSFQSPTYRQGLAQAVTATPPVAVTTPPKPPPFLDSALSSVIFDIFGVMAFGNLAYFSNKANNTPLTLINGIIAGFMGIKALSDLSEVRKR